MVDWWRPWWWWGWGRWWFDQVGRLRAGVEWMGSTAGVSVACACVLVGLDCAAQRGPVDGERSGGRGQTRGGGRGKTAEIWERRQLTRLLLRPRRVNAVRWAR
jgi:hypothetical protein